MFTGIISPITTPFINDEVAHDKMRENLQRWNASRLSAYLVLGSNGEAAFLTGDEKLKLIETVARYKSADKKLIVGSGSDSIRETVFISNEAARLGADAVLVLTPSFYKPLMTGDAFKCYFRAVADDAHLPVLIYNVPKFSGVQILPETIAELSGHPNIVGIKHSTSNLGQLAEIINSSDKNFNVLLGSAAVIYAGLSLGADGAIAAPANIVPDACVQIYDDFTAGRHEQARSGQFRLLELNKLVTEKYGIPGLKAAMDMLGYFGGKARRPVPDVTEKQIAEIKTAMERFKASL